MAGSSLAEVFPRLSAVHALSMLRPRMRPPPPLAAPADADALATAAAGASSADNGVARVWRTWPLPAAAGRATNTEEPISNGRSPADSIFPAPLVSSSAKRKRDGIRSDDSEFGEEEDEDVESVEENDAIAAHDRNPHCSHESSAAALTSAVGFAYPADQAWQWQAWQESTCYSWARSVLSPTTQDGDNAVSRAEEVETCSTVAPLAQDVPDHSTEEEQLIHARCMEAVADMWEPHRRQYGEYAWWAQDQPFERRKFIRCGDTFGETLEFEELPECGEVAVQAEPKDNAQNGRRSTFGADIAHLVGKVWSIDELLREVANLDDAEFFEEPEGGVGVSRSRLQRYGMTVERDVVYDESELTPEEIAIQRWSVEWRKTRE
ncbi:hypothetical protein DFJ73DRAFT_871702 [Zopfochytrium polystomum]|nr:hypothetical protein DFJ73DRAFT_871702 [Zopfochytrium polystomum]